MAALDYYSLENEVYKLHHFCFRRTNFTNCRRTDDSNSSECQGIISKVSINSNVMYEVLKIEFLGKYMNFLEF